jgi:hypothetical protein
VTWKTAIINGQWQTTSEGTDGVGLSDGKGQHLVEVLWLVVVDVLSHCVLEDELKGVLSSLVVDDEM